MSLLAIYMLSGLTGVGIGIATPLIPLLLRQRGASGLKPRSLASSSARGLHLSVHSVRRSSR